jgi:hypothetical protein
MAHLSEWLQLMLAEIERKRDEERERSEDRSPPQPAKPEGEGMRRAQSR